MRFYGIIGAAITAAIGLLLWLLFPYFLGKPLEPDVLKILVPALLVVLGWLVTFLLQEYRRMRERSEREIDLKLALRAEIWDFRQAFENAHTVSYGAKMVDKINQGADGKNAFHPFVPQEKNPIIFSVLAPRIDNLPSSVVEEVVQFYGQLADLSAFAQDLRSEKLTKLSAARRAAAYGDYIEMKMAAYNLAVLAHAKLEKSLGVSPRNISTDAQQKRKQSLILWVNSQAEGRDDQE